MSSLCVQGLLISDKLKQGKHMNSLREKGKNGKITIKIDKNKIVVIFLKYVV